MHFDSFEMGLFFFSKNFQEHEALQQGILSQQYISPLHGYFSQEPFTLLKVWTDKCFVNKFPTSSICVCLAAQWPVAGSQSGL